MRLNLTLIGIAFTVTVGSYANAQDLFTNVTSSSGIGGKGYSAAPADFDGDGDLDIAIGSNVSNDLRLYRNISTGSISFTNGTSAAGLPTNLASARTITWADYDNDGDVDLFVGRESNGNNNNNFFRNNGNGTFTDVSNALGLTSFGTDPRGSAWADLDHDGDLDLYLANAKDFNGTQDRLWRNDPNGFVEITTSANLPVTNDPAFGIAFADYDQDGDQDLYVETGQIGTAGGVPWPNKLLRNQFMDTGSISFVDVAPALGLDAKGEGYATFWFDFDNDHDFDLYHALFSGGLDVFGEGNKLFQNDGDGTFTDISASAGVVHAFQDNGCHPLDFNFDGLEDMYISSFSNGASDLLRNNGDGTFTEPSNDGANGNTGGGNIIPGDFDSDGDLDMIYISFLSSGNRVYRNDGINLGNYLKVKLIGTESNFDGVGAMVRVVTADGVSRRMQRSIGSGYGSMVDPTLSFGLGSNTSAETVEVVWPKSRIVQVLVNQPANQTITIVEQGTPTVIVTASGSGSIGSLVRINLRGTPGASATLLASIFDGPLSVPPHGTLLLGSPFFFLLNGLSGAGPLFPANGKLVVPGNIPNLPSLIGVKIWLQGAETTATSTILGNACPLLFKP